MTDLQYSFVMLRYDMIVFIQWFNHRKVISTENKVLI